MNGASSKKNFFVVSLNQKRNLWVEGQLKHMLEYGIRFGYCKTSQDVSGGTAKVDIDQNILSRSLNKILR